MNISGDYILQTMRSHPYRYITKALGLKALIQSILTSSANTNALELTITAAFLIAFTVCAEWLLFDIIPGSAAYSQSIEILAGIFAAIFIATLLTALALKTAQAIDWRQYQPFQLLRNILPSTATLKNLRAYLLKVRLFARRHGAYQLFPLTQSLRVQCR